MADILEKEPGEECNLSECRGSKQSLAKLRDVSVLRTCHVFLKLGMHKRKGCGGTAQGVWGTALQSVHFSSSQCRFNPETWVAPDCHNKPARGKGHLMELCN